MRIFCAVLLALSLIVLPVNASRSFNGTSDLITAPGISNLLDISSGPTTVAFWFYPTTSNTTLKDLVSHWNFSNNTAQFYVASGGNPEGQGASANTVWEIGCCGALNGVYGTCGANTVNAWHQVVLFVDSAGKYYGSPTAGLLEDGANCGVQAFREKRSAGGANVVMANGAFPGRICDVAVWNDILSTLEINALLHGVPAYRIRQTSLVGYWPLWGASGSSAEPDLSTHRYNGTLTGTSVANHCPVSN